MGCLLGCMGACSGFEAVGFEDEDAVTKGVSLYPSICGPDTAGFERAQRAPEKRRDVHGLWGTGGVDDDEVPFAAPVGQRIAGGQDFGLGFGAQLGVSSGGAG
ncbi:hypothetical protein D9M72_585580 [compost metagenome]